MRVKERGRRAALGGVTEEVRATGPKRTKTINLVL